MSTLTRSVRQKRPLGRESLGGERTIFKRINPDFIKAFGPGLLFAGVSVGVSHLVQSTRAGALYGLGLLAAILIIHIVKYPLFRFGAYYPARTGESLLDGYRRLGWYAVVLFAVIIVAYVFIAIAAVSLLTTALIQAVTGLGGNTILLTILLLVLSGVFLVVWRFHGLDRLNKLLVAVLLISTLLATVFALPRVQWSFWPADVGAPDLRLLVFIVALAGLMPTSADISVWQSLWTVAKAEDEHKRPRTRSVMLDFNIGYVGSVVLAVCFVVMGAGMMHAGGIAPAAKATPFAGQILDLYTNSLGAWSGAIVGAATISIMLTTVLTALDALPRVLVALYRLFAGEPSATADSSIELDATPAYRLFLAILIGGASLVLYYFVESLSGLVDFVSTLTFVSAPVIAILNHQVIFGPILAPEHRPGRLYRLWSLAGILVLGAITVAYLYLRLSGALDGA